MTRDVAAIRSAFPALERREGGRPVAYFDGPGGTQVPAPVADAVRSYLLEHNANTHWSYPSSRETDALLGRARLALAEFLNAAPDEIAFGANMTTVTFHLARGLGRRWGPDDEIVVTDLDHQANVAPWQALERERGVRLRRVPFHPADGTLDLEALAAALSPRTRLVALGAASNALGTVTDVAAVSPLVRARGALLFVDAVHYAPHHLVDVRQLGCDFLACSAYKFYGPHLGVLFARRDAGAALDVPRLDPAPDTMPERLETGTQNHEGIAGALAAVDFLASLAPGAGRRERLTRVFADLHVRGQGLVARLWKGLGAIPGVTRYGPPPGLPRTPTVAFTVRGREPRDVAAALAADGVFLSHGDFYASRVIAGLGVGAEGLIRAGCACYTTDGEVERLLEGVRRLS